MQTELNGRPQAMIAMSGGVDSSVAAYLMQQAGYAVCRAFLMSFVFISTTLRCWVTLPSRRI